ncbi:MAG: YbhB/YbcL family Raf kinase inhibitor-like protein [Candidatus Gracilibacteria bacterium]|nr:YbhB/YbcL family Raf kinase inhibitor-like protein [Candidatus Gracilibacteria bacterium]
MQELFISSSNFEDNSFISSDFTCDGYDKIPSFVIEKLPIETKSIVLIVDDPDAPKGTWVHFVAFDIDNRGQTSLSLFTDNIDNYYGFKRGKNSSNELFWHGPCPPKGHGVHRYFFKVYALNIDKVDLSEGIYKDELLNYIKDNIIGYGQIIAKYERK